MKKIFVIFMLLSCLFMCSCNSAKANNEQLDNDSQNENHSEQQDDSQKGINNEKTSNTTSGSSNKGSSGSSAMPIGWGITNYDEYLEYIENNELPEGFVYYEDIKQFGEFDALSAPAGIGGKDAKFVSYGYHIIDGNGYEHYFSLTNSKGTKFTEQINDEDIQIDLSDMRYLVSGKGGQYFHNNIRYSYGEGQLLSIKWYENGWLYTIFDFDEGYPPNDGSALAKLIYLE